MIQFLLGVAVGASIMLFNFIFLICHWDKKEDKSSNLSCHDKEKE